jgi:hypothetical protein
MKTIFSHIFVNYAEYQYFITLPKHEQLYYLFDIYEVEHKKGNGLDLSTFFEAVKSTLSEPESDTSFQTHDFEEYPGAEDADRVDVMIDDHNIMIESNSLKALRFVTYKFVESGYILQRDRVVEKLFKRDKVTKYLRVFKIINQLPDLCFN